MSSKGRECRGFGILRALSTKQWHLFPLFSENRKPFWRPFSARFPENLPLFRTSMFLKPCRCGLWEVFSVGRNLSSLLQPICPENVRKVRTCGMTCRPYAPAMFLISAPSGWKSSRSSHLTQPQAGIHAPKCSFSPHRAGGILTAPSTIVPEVRTWRHGLLWNTWNYWCPGEISGLFLSSLII